MPVVFPSAGSPLAQVGAEPGNLVEMRWRRASGSPELFVDSV